MKTAILVTIIALIMLVYSTQNKADSSIGNPGWGPYHSEQYNYYELQYLQNRRALEEQRRQTEIMKKQLDQQEDMDRHQREESFRRDVRRILGDDE